MMSKIELIEVFLNILKVGGLWFLILLLMVLLGSFLLLLNRLRGWRHIKRIPRWVNVEWTKTGESLIRVKHYEYRFDGKFPYGVPVYRRFRHRRKK